MQLIFLCSLGSASCYVLAALVMKHWDGIGGLPATAFVVLALSGAVLLETEALRHARLGYVFMVIMGQEVSLTMLCGWILLREAYPPHEILGFLLIMLGLAVAHLPPALPGTQPD